MIRRLFFAATLLLPCLAYGEDSSSNLPIDVVPPGLKSTGEPVKPVLVLEGPAALLLSAANA
jgi:hypothetical protein